MTGTNNTMTVSLALAEMKLLDKKIQKKTTEIVVAGNCTAKDKVDAERELAVHSENMQSTLALITRRNAIKKAVLQSNGTVTVTVGTTSYTVAEAIERKKSIQYEKDLERRMRENYYGMKSANERHMLKVRNDATTSTEKILVAQGIKTEDGKMVSADDSTYKTFYDKYIENHGVVFVQIKDVEKKIEEMREDIDQFEMLIDNALSVSNATTSITIVV